MNNKTKNPTNETLKSINILDIRIKEKNNINSIFYNIIKKKKILIILFITLILLYLFFYFIKEINLRIEGNKLKEISNIISNETYKSRNPERNFDINFKYNKYQNELLTDRIKNNSNWQLGFEEPNFINGIIRKYKPKKCLEIGVAYGGSSIIILNAIKDIENSFLISLDLNTNVYTGENVKTGYNVYKYFPELTNKWKLYTGNQPHKFLDKLNIKFDFLYLDTVHSSPGEMINIIEALPFLEDNAIIVLHDVMYHFASYNSNYFPVKKYHFSNIYVMTSLMGDKVVIENKSIGLENIGAIRLFPNQEKYYINYFMLLLSPWEYLPSPDQIEDLRIFIKKYYRKDIYLNIFNKAVKENEIYINK